MPTDPEFAAFLKSYPTYPSTAALDRLRASDYARLDQAEHVYLDYTGGGLYAEEIIRPSADVSDRAPGRRPPG